MGLYDSWQNETRFRGGETPADRLRSQREGLAKMRADREARRKKREQEREERERERRRKREERHQGRDSSSSEAGERTGQGGAAEGEELPYNQTVRADHQNGSKMQAKQDASKAAGTSGRGRGVLVVGGKITMIGGW